MYLQTSNKWILNSFFHEALFLYVPTILCLFLSFAFSDWASRSYIYALLALVVIDSGHVYTTLWRTYFHKAEFLSNITVYVITPIAIALCFFIWSQQNFFGLWTFVIYATIFHQIRQNYGILKWYEKLNSRNSELSTYFFYGLSLLPLIAYHFRDDVVRGFYTNFDLLMLPNENYFLVVFYLWLATLLAWIFHEIWLIKNNTREWNRILFLTGITALYALCFFIGKKSHEVLFPLLVAHGFTYFILMSHSLPRTQNKKFKSFFSALFIIILTALIFGATDSWVEQNFISFDREKNLVTSLIIGLYLTPLFTHFALDAYIWKKSHREAQFIFSAPADNKWHSK